MDRLNGLGSPLGIETVSQMSLYHSLRGLNGLGSPLGIETLLHVNEPPNWIMAKWPGKPVGD